MKSVAHLLHKHKVLLIIWLLTLVTQTLPLTLSSSRPDGSLVVTSAHDSLWHLSLINELSQTFPPNHPGFAGEPLKNYHYVSDFFLSLLTHIGFSSWFIYYRLAPILVSSLFVISAYLLSTTVIKAKTFVYLATFFIIFSGSLGYIVPILGLGDFGYSNTFMLDQPFEMLTNVHTILGFSLFMLVLYLIHQGLKTKNTKVLLLSGLLAGFLYGIKAYGSLILLGGILVAGLIEYLQHKKIRLLLYAWIPACLMFGLLYLTSSHNSSGLVFAPGWLLSKMIEDGNRLNGLTQLATRLSIYTQQGEWLQLTIVYVGLFGIYLIGNLGARLVSLLQLRYWLSKPKHVTPFQILITTAIIVSLLMPVLFLQASSAYNILQFGQYGLILTSLLSVVWLEKTKLSLKNKYLLAGLMLGLQLPTSIAAVYRNLTVSQTREIVSVEEREAIEYLKNNTPRSSTVLIHPESKHTFFLLIPGLAARRTYYSGHVLAELTQIDTSHRLERMVWFFSDQTNLIDKIAFLDEAGINYIYLESAYLPDIPVLMENKYIELEFSNSEITIYKVIKDKNN